MARNSCERGITLRDWEQYAADKDIPSEQILCFFKCAHERDGSIDSNGMVILEEVNKSLMTWKAFKQPHIHHINKCLKTVPPIKTCSDMKAFNHCIKMALESSCEIEAGFTFLDWDEFSTAPLAPTEKMLCFFKCMYEKSGSIDSLGSIVLDKIDADIDRLAYLEDHQKSNVKSCLIKLPPVKTCQDMRTIIECIFKETMNGTV
ncbi:hypothetical protein HHI36_022204 [Cryptolaemus montrouzieri]|uniref:Uncharacterized protein n=1 Tax=Cryptolaemus montrouzieri TaxID=559131 RepID=A0ABD2MZD4_9CUCU